MFDALTSQVLIDLKTEVREMMVLQLTSWRLLRKAEEALMQVDQRTEEVAEEMLLFQNLSLVTKRVQEVMDQRLTCSHQLKVQLQNQSD